jgi:hypothetical protein
MRHGTRGPGGKAVTFGRRWRGFSRRPAEVDGPATREYGPPLDSRREVVAKP